MLPPYGKPSDQLRTASDPTPMLDWTGGQTAFDNFIKQIGDDIEEYIWPSYDQSSNSWIGTSASFAEQATKLELELMISKIQATGVIRQDPDTPHYAGAHPSRTQYWHYQVEDQLHRRLNFGDTGFSTEQLYYHQASIFPMSNIELYHTFFDPGRIRSQFGEFAGRKYAGTFQLKLRFNRPRPQQAAYILGLNDFEWHQARSHVHTGNHPSIISGHCAQGLLVTAGILEQLIADGEDDPDVVDALAQMAVDFGDRRVFAGVHYPTDNIASWIMCLRLARQVFGDGARVHAFMSNALMNKSFVYRLVTDEFPNHGIYDGAIKLLEAELSNSGV